VVSNATWAISAGWPAAKTAVAASCAVCHGAAAAIVTLESGAINA
jgi:cytochrome c553